MAPVRLISLGKQFTLKIDWEKIDWEDKDSINLPHVIGYYFGAKTDKMSIAKTYEDENTMIVTLQIPKSNYKNKSFQNLLKCPELPVQDEYYYRDWAVHMVMAGDNEKTVLFSHGRVTLDVKDNAKADYVTVEVVVKQKEDMLRGVVFGLELEETYKEAWEKVMNPVGLNVVVPVVAVSSGVVLTGIKNAKEVLEDESLVVDEGERDFAIGGDEAKLWISGTFTPAYNSSGSIYIKDMWGAGANVSLEQHATNQSKGGCISYWYENNIRHATYNPEMKNRPLRLIRYNNKVDIYADLYFTGSYAKKYPSNTAISYEDLAYAGITRTWSNNSYNQQSGKQPDGSLVTYDDFGKETTINVYYHFDKLNDAKAATQPYIKIDIEETGQPITPSNISWSIGKNHSISLFTKFVPWFGNINNF